jgi:hypothetical protein
MRKIVKLTESDLIRIVKKVVNEEKESTDSYYSKGPQTPHQVAKKWDNITDDYFFTTFIRKFKTKEKLEKKFPEWDDMIEYLENNFDDFPGEDYIYDFFDELKEVNW